MSRILAIGDIHGGLRGLHQIIERAKVTTDDTLIFLGDYVDGWSQSPQVIDFLLELSEKQNCIFIKGNHDQLVLDWLENRTENIDEPMWFKHGGEATVIAYSEISEEKKNRHIQFFKALENYYLDEHTRLFVHAGFTNMNGVKYEYFPKLFYWDRTLWETAVSLDDRIEKTSLYYPKRLKLYKEIYIGHTPTTFIKESIPVNKACIWNIDTGAAFKGRITIMDINSKEFWQSEPLYTLYFDEKGRN